MILTAEDPRSGYCYAKYEPIVFNLWGGPGYPAMGGITRLDLVSADNGVQVWQLDGCLFYCNQQVRTCMYVCSGRFYRRGLQTCK